MSRVACSRRGSKLSDSAKAVRPFGASPLLLRFELSPLLTTAQRFFVTLQSGLGAKALSHSTSQNVLRGPRPLRPFRSAPVLALLQPAFQRFFVRGSTLVFHSMAVTWPDGGRQVPLAPACNSPEVSPRAAFSRRRPLSDGSRSNYSRVLWSQAPRVHRDILLCTASVYYHGGQSVSRKITAPCRRRQAG